MTRLRSHFESPGTLVPSSRPRTFFERIGLTLNGLSMFIIGLIIYAVIIGFIMLAILSALEYADTGRISSRTIQALIKVIVDLLPWSGR